MNKTFCASQNMEAKTWCLRVFLLWMAFICCCPLSWLPIWLWSKVVDPCFIHCCIFTHNLLFVVLKQLQITLNHQRVAVFDRLRANVTPTLNTTFPLTNIHAKWWIHCLLIFSTLLLSHATSIYNQPKKVWGFFGVFKDKCRVWVTWAFSFICVCTTAFKVSIPSLNHCVQWSRVQITLIKPLLCLNSIFPHQQAMFYQHRFFHCFENLQK